LSISGQNKEQQTKPMNSFPKFRISMLLLLTILGGIAHSSRALALPPSWRTSEGVIQFVCTSCETVGFRDSKSQKQYVLDVTPRTKVYSNGRLLPFSALLPGTQALVTRKHPVFTPAFAKKIAVVGHPNPYRGTNPARSPGK
jgi:hypothetical protein